MSFLLGVIAAGFDMAGDRRSQDTLASLARDAARFADGFNTSFEVVECGRNIRCHFRSARERLITWRDFASLAKHEALELFTPRR